MAIIKEEYKTLKNGTVLYKTYSDSSYKIKQVETDLIFEEAVDVESSTFIYEETEEVIETQESEQE